MINKPTKEINTLEVFGTKCNFEVLVLLPVRALLCGRLPHTAPLVLPARPRADKTTLLLSRHHTHTLLGGEVRRATRTSRDLVF